MRNASVADSYTHTLMEREAVEADVSVAVSVAGRRLHLELLFCIRKHGLEWRRFEEAFGYVGSDVTKLTLQVSVWLDDVFHLYGGQRSASCALDLFDEYSVVDPERQLGSTSHPCQALTRSVLRPFAQQTRVRLHARELRAVLGELQVQRHVSAGPRRRRR